MSSSPSRVTLRGKTSRHGVSLSGKSSNAAPTSTPSIPTPADGMAGLRGQISPAFGAPPARHGGAPGGARPPAPATSPGPAQAGQPADAGPPQPGRGGD